MQPTPRFETDAGIDESRVRGVSPVEFLPAALRAEQLGVVLVVVLGCEGEQGDDLLEREESGIAVDVAKHLELTAQERIDFAPCTGIEHATREVGSANGHFLGDTGAHADEADEMDIAKPEVIKQTDGIVRVQ